MQGCMIFHNNHHHIGNETSFISGQSKSMPNGAGDIPPCWSGIR